MKKQRTFWTEEMDFNSNTALRIVAAPFSIIPKAYSKISAIKTFVAGVVSFAAFILSVSSETIYSNIKTFLHLQFLDPAIPFIRQHGLEILVIFILGYSSLVFTVSYFIKCHQLEKYKKCEKYFQDISSNNHDCDVSLFDKLFVEIAEEFNAVSFGLGNDAKAALEPLIRQTNKSKSGAENTIRANINLDLNSLAKMLSEYVGSECVVTLKKLKEDDKSVKTVARGTVSPNVPDWATPINFPQSASETPFDHLINARAERFVSNSLPTWFNGKETTSEYVDTELSRLAKKYKYKSILVIPVKTPSEQNDTVAFLQAICQKRGLADEQCTHYMTQLGLRIAALLYRKAALK